MTDIDRQGRSGDHVPFYNLGAMAARICSFNEPGDGFGAGREHLTLDSGGVDTKLRLRVVINTQTGYPAYRLGIRTTSYDFDSVYTFTQIVDTLQMPVSGNLTYYASIASQDVSQVESLFGSEINLLGTGSFLAVELSQFSANLVNDNDVLVQWRVATINSSDKYVVERSDDAMHFKAIDSINATSSYVYSFDDVYPLTGRSYYRLRMISGNQYDFSPTVSISTSATKLTQVIPSLAHDYIIVKTKASGKPAKITDMQGRNFMKFIINDGMKVNIANIPSGLYLLRINGGEVIKFIKN